MSASESATPRLYAEALAASHENRAGNFCRSVSADAGMSSKLPQTFSLALSGCLRLIPLSMARTSGRQAQYPVREVAAASIVVGLLAVMFLAEERSLSRRRQPAPDSGDGTRNLRIPVQSVLVLLAFSLLLDLRSSYRRRLLLLSS